MSSQKLVLFLSLTSKVSDSSDLWNIQSHKYQKDYTEKKGDVFKYQSGFPSFKIVPAEHSI